MKFFKMIINNFWIKVISLMLAVFTWFYVINIIENTTGENTIIAKILPSYNRMIAKKLFVKAVFIGETPSGYKLILEEVRVEPSYMILAGPRYIMNQVGQLETVPIDISGYKKTMTIDAQISPVAQSIDTEKLIIKVTIPVKKIETKPEAPQES